MKPKTIQRHRTGTPVRVSLALIALVGISMGGLGCGSTPPPEESVRPGFNDAFLDPDLNVFRHVSRFESESREIFAQRQRIAETVALEAGQSVADIGAGTGIFVEPFARAVGSEGRVYAVEIAAPFVEHIESLARDLDLPQVQAVLCTERSVSLPDKSIDVAFVCDTYHHFEYPKSTLASLHSALRSGGRLVIVDFIRIEGESRDWILDHVRAGQDEFSREIEAAGFQRLEDPVDDFLAENYIMHFEKK